MWNKCIGTWNKITFKITQTLIWWKNSLLDDVEKSEDMKAWLFAKLCEDMRANYMSFLYYCELRFGYLVQK